MLLISLGLAFLDISRQSTGGDKDAPTFYSGWEYAGAPIVRSLGTTGFKGNYPIVERTGDASAMDDALRQGPSTVRALVFHGKNPIIECAKDRDCDGTEFQTPSTARGDVVYGTYFNPFQEMACHAVASMGMTSRAWNSCLSLPDARSLHGSV